MSFQTLPPANQIPIEDFLLRCEKIFTEVPSTQYSVTGAQVQELFKLHNDKLLPRETGQSCSGCRMRVYTRLKNYYDSIKNNNTSE